MQITQKIRPCLWFDDQAEEAARHYIAIFPNSEVVALTRYGAAGHEIHKRPVGSVMTVDFVLDGHPFTALNGGPLFKFNEAISFQVLCDLQDEIDYFWAKLAEGGDPKAQQCGWLKDKFGVSWQIVPRGMVEMLRDPGSKGAQRAMTALLRMKKIDIDELERASAG
jgi:predicted 3-demethylubiquinone-9 3-methyltransferase (glyoxalase superfamily)